MAEFKKLLHQRLWTLLSNPYVYTDKNIARAIGNYHEGEHKGRQLKKIMHRHLIRLDPWYREEFRKFDPDTILYFWRDIQCCYGCLSARGLTCKECAVEDTCKTTYRKWSDLLETQEADLPFNPRMARKLAWLAMQVAFTKVRLIIKYLNGRYYFTYEITDKMKTVSLDKIQGEYDHPISK